MTILNQRKYPHGPFLVLAAFPSTQLSKFNQIIYSAKSDYQLHLQDSGMGWAAAVISIHNIMRSEWSLHQLFNDANARAQLIEEVARVTQILSPHGPFIPLQFPTICDYMCSVHRLLLQQSVLFDEILPFISDRKEYDIEIASFSAALLANDLYEPKISNFSAKNLKVEQIKNLCQAALSQDLVWANPHDIIVNNRLKRKITCLLSCAEKTIVEDKINQLGALAGIVGLSLSLSHPRHPSDFLQSYNLEYIPIIQDNTAA